jgi:hypothetical protein
MLRDHRFAQERWAANARRYRRNVSAYGDFFLMMNPDWIATITFNCPHAPSSNRALKLLEAFLHQLEDAAGRPIGWVIAQDRGDIGKRLHFHLLIAGVSHLRTTIWWRIAFKRFGRTRIEPFSSTRGGAHYVAKNCLAECGELHFGGQLLAKGTRLANTWERDFGTELPYKASPTKPRPVGRPKRKDIDPVLIAVLLRRGFSFSAIAKAWNVGIGTVRQIHADWLARLARRKKNRDRARRGRQRARRIPGPGEA